MKSMGSARKDTRFFTFNYVLQAAVIGGLFIAATFMLWGQANSPIRAAQIAVDSGGRHYLTHVATDKPIYRTGEKLYVAVLFLARPVTPP